MLTSMCLLVYIEIMPRKPKRPTSAKKMRVTFLLDGDVVARADRRALQLNSETPGASVTRTEVFRRAICLYLESGRE